MAAGGIKGEAVTASAELFDPNAAPVAAPSPAVPVKGAPQEGSLAGAWQPARGLAHTRFAHTATLLKDGRLLVIGGAAKIERKIPKAAILSSSEIFDPATGAWMPAGAMSQPRGFFGPIGREGQSLAVPFTSTLLHDGRVLVAGGSDRSADIYDPAPLQQSQQAKGVGSLSRLFPFVLAAILAMGLLVLLIKRKKA